MTDREAEGEGVVRCQDLEAEGPRPRRHASQPDGWLLMGHIPPPPPQPPQETRGPEEKSKQKHRRLFLGRFQERKESGF